LVEVQGVVSHLDEVVVAIVGHVSQLYRGLNLPLPRYFLGSFGAKHVDVSYLISPQYNLFHNMNRKLSHALDQVSYVMLKLLYLRSICSSYVFTGRVSTTISLGTLFQLLKLVAELHNLCNAILTRLDAQACNLDLRSTCLKLFYLFV